jgi:signal transduction histidine kinase
MLAKIGDNSREMVENMSDIVWSVNPKNDSARFLLDRMRVFADDLVASSGLQLRFDFDKDVEDVKLSMEQRKNIFLIFKETVYNSVKYSGGKNLLISMRKNGGKLVLVIKDDGKGFDVNNYKSKNGNGIQNMRLRAEEILSVYRIESSEKGTQTTLDI